MAQNEKYGVKYFESETDSDSKIFTNNSNELYSYKVFCGSFDLSVEAGDSLIYLDSDLGCAYWVSGPCHINSANFAVMLRGYQCGDKACSLSETTNLPYVNGCSTRQIFSPERIGDPTLQQLTIPPHTSEQVHHIHPTARAVFVLSGEGYSLVGQSGDVQEVKLTKGMVCVLDPMCPHHFRTDGKSLTVLPVHVWSSTPASMESNHPMFNGTKEV